MANASSRHVLSYAWLVLFFSFSVFEATAVEYASQFVNDLETVVPPYLDAFGAPSAQVKVEFRTNSTVGKVKLGKRYDRNQTQAQPHVSFTGSAIEKSSFYSLLTVDPDVPSPTNVTFRNILHWLVVNIPGDLWPYQDIAKVGTVVAPYVGPAPPNGTHRYIFLLFSQGSRMISPPAYPRPLFSVRNFTDTYDLGWPLGGTLFRASFDDQ